MKKQNIITLLVISLTLFSASACNSQKTTTAAKKHGPHIIAHRGYWDVEGSAQNSRKALELAIEHGFYGCEFDVHLTKDNILVVFHDNEIEEKNIQQSNFAELKDLKLSNGETLPTLDQYLQIAAKQNKTKLILELKPHQSEARNREAAQEVGKLIKKYKLEKLTEYISFSMDACKEFIRLNSANKVYFLHWEAATAPTPQDLHQAGFRGLDYSYVALKTKPEWITEAQRLGMAVNVWTVDDENDMQLFIEAGVDFITTDKPKLLEQLINEKQAR